MKQNRSVYFAALLHAFITGNAFIFVKTAISEASPFDLLAYRFNASFAAIIILLVFRVVKVKYSLKKVICILPITLFYPLLFFALQTFGLKYLSSSEAGIFSALTPVFTLILASFLLNEKTTMLQRISVFVSVIGVVYIALMKGTSFQINSYKGIILILLSSLSFSFYSIFAKLLSNKATGMESSILMNFIGFLFFNIMAISKHGANGSLSGFFLPLYNLKFVVSILYLGVLSTFFTSFLVNFALSKLDASKMSVFSNLSTVINIVAGVIFLKEDLFYYHIIGSILIIIGILGANFMGKKHLRK